MAENAIQNVLSPLPSNGRPDPTLPIACDACYARKIRCDRKCPCGNCVDSRVRCLRERQKAERKSRDPFSKEVIEALNDIRKRMINLEQSVDKIATRGSTVADRKTKKRTSDEAFGPDDSQQSSPSKSREIYITAEPDNTINTPYSAHEGQILIQRELVRKPGLSRKKFDIFHSALLSLKKSLDISTNKDDEAATDAISHELIDNPRIPEISLMQYMVQSEESGRGVCASDAFMPFTSRKTIGRMVRVVMAEDGSPRDLPSLICVTSKVTGMEGRLQDQAVQLFATARALTWQLVKQGAPASLEALQAVTYGFMLAQEAGDCATAWELIGVATKICIALNLHKNVSCVTGSPADVSYEAYYCFAICYMHDKGLAMNLGRSPFLSDSILEFDLLSPPPPTAVNFDNFRIYLELSRIQNLIITQLRLESSKSRQPEILAQISAKLDQIWRLLDMIKGHTRESASDKYNSEIDSTMVEFAFHSIKSVAFHTVSDNSQSPQIRQQGLMAARSALQDIQRVRELARFSRYSTNYMKNSFAHWTIMYYPFTPFFVLFCNVISTQTEVDYHRMKQFIEYLAEVQHISDKALKLYKLCLPFCSLAFSILNSAEGSLGIANEESEVSFKMSENQGSNEQNRFSFRPTQQIQVAPGSTGQFQSQSIPHNHESQQDTEYLNDVNTNTGLEFQDPGYVWDLMGTQPMLQWLDSDFTAFEQAWAPIGDDFPPP